MSGIDEIRKKKAEELKKTQLQEIHGQLSEEQEIQKQMQELESIVKTKFTKDALERYGNIKAADPIKAIQLISLLVELLQSGKVGIIDDNLLKEILIKITPKKKDFRIKRM